MTELLIRAGRTRHGPYSVILDPGKHACARVGLRVLDLAARETVELAPGDTEHLVLSLQGSAQIDVDSERIELLGRAHPFSGPSDAVYAPRRARLRVSSALGGRFAICSALCTRTLPLAYLPHARVPVELRGAGASSRQVHRFGFPEVLDADRLIACEVLTPGGNWSSYPPHRHDRHGDGEVPLEEIYYFEVASGPAAPGIAIQRVYSSDDLHPIDVTVEVRDGDVVLVPHGWHGPTIAAPGYDLYYLNVMAGSTGRREWLAVDDPDHAWIRGTWAGMPIDPRLPFGGRR